MGWQNRSSPTNTATNYSHSSSRYYSIHTGHHTFIEGDNLDVLRTLQKSYFGQVKMIYIDPPYNTGNDSFVYPDNYAETRKNYDKRTGQVDENGHIRQQSALYKNIKGNGQFHSVWLSMMYPRLYLSRNLLRQDGVIFISIDDNEAANLKLLCDEVFGSENFVVNAIWEKVKIRKNSARWFSDSHDHVLIYCKNKELWERYLLPRTDTSNYKNPDNDERGVWIPIPIHANHKYDANYKITKPNGVVLERPKNNYWRLSENTIKQYIEENRLWWGEGDSYPMIKRFLTEVQDGLVPKSIFYYDEVGGNPHGDSELKDLFNGNKFFDNPKSVGLIKAFLQISTGKDDIILDFFAGSGTTAQAVMELNEEDGGSRQFVCVQIAEATEESSEAYKAGYTTIADITRARIAKVVAKIEERAAQNQAAYQKVSDEQAILKTELAEIQKTAQLDTNGKVSASKEAEKLIAQINKKQAEIDKYAAKGAIYERLDLSCGYYQLADSNFKQWQSDVSGEEAIKELLLDFQKSEESDSQADNMFIELCLKMGLGLNVAHQKENGFYKTQQKERIWFCFEPYAANQREEIAQAENQPKKLVYLSSCFENDQDLSNFRLELETQQIDLTIV